jgi:uncharacterized protein with von Willebrand factor type A (vWA) domain
LSPGRPVDPLAGPAAGARADAALLGFARALRAAGVDASAERVHAFLRAVDALQAGMRADVYWAGRLTLCGGRDDLERYERVFAAYFGGAAAPMIGEPVVRAVELQVDAEDDAGADDGSPDDEDDDSDEGPEADTQALRWSRTEILRHKDLAACTADELDEAHRLMADLRVHAALRRTRRRRPDPHDRGRLDLGRSVRRALRTGGEVLRPAATRPGERPRRLVVLLDVSGSMEPYSRALARWAHAAVAARRRGRVEAFALGTRVTRITPELSGHDPDQALTRAAEAVADWSGGTRLGDGLRWFNERWGVRGLARGAVVVILSDGWDRGDPDVLGAEMARLRRVAHRVVWVNPLKASPGYAPLARGMAAALPHVDELVEGHSLASLENLAAMVAG